MTPDETTARLKNIKRVADQSCSAHAHLRDRYNRRAFALDLVILSASAWTLALSFADVKIAAKLTPPGFSSVIWTGLMGVAIFTATLAQLKLDWKARADSHKRACEAQANVKKIAGSALRHEDDPDRFLEVEAQQALAEAVGVPIPETEFVNLKRKHLQKVALSKYLDEHPFASPFWLSVRWWWRDNLSRTCRPALGSGQATESRVSRP